MAVTQSGGSTLDSRPSTSVKILDLGLALLGEAHMAHENELTTVGQLMGTLDYMSPEQGMDSHVVDIRADIYSLGATLYKLLTGRAPFAAPQYNTLLKKVTALANQPVKPVKELRPDIPDELAAIIDRTLAKEPQDRFNTPNELAAAARTLCSGRGLERSARCCVKRHRAGSSFAASRQSIPRCHADSSCFAQGVQRQKWLT